MFRSYRFLSTSLLLILTACSSFSGDDDQSPSNDSSAPPVPSGEQQEADADGGVVDGTANVAFELTVDSSKITLTHGQSTKVPFKIVRKQGFSDAVLVRVGGMPASLASAPVTVPAASDAGELDVVVASDLAQGPLTGLTIEASATDGRGNSSLPLDAFVRGAPGELDTTFGTNGFIDFGSDNDVNVGTAPDGRIFVSRGPFVRRYSSDGQLDATFGDAGTLRVANAPGTAVFYGPTGIFQKNTFPINGTPHIAIGRLTFEGLADGAFGGSGFFSAFPTASTQVRSLAIAPSGKVAAVGNLSDKSALRIYWLTSAGLVDRFGGNAPDGYSAANAPSELVDGIYVDDDTFVGVGQSRAIRTKQGVFDTTFGQGGVSSVAKNSVLSSIAIDGQNRYVLSGLAPGGAALYLVRLLPNGIVDSSLDGVLGGFTVVASGGIKVDPAGRILQAGSIAANGVNQCVLVRYDANGVRDASFGVNGLASPGIDGCDPRYVIVQADGRILVGGGDGPRVVRLWN